MKPIICLATIGIFLLNSHVQGQFTTDNRTFDKSLKINAQNRINGRSAANPTTCGSDTSLFTYYEASQLNSVSIMNGSSLGQFYGVPQSMTISGFRFFGYALPTTPKNIKVRLIASIYAAGADSLPNGAPLGSDTITVDTVMGSNIPLKRITRNAIFKSPVTLSSGAYILVVSCDSTSVRGAIVTNSWTQLDGGKKNLGSGSVSGKWYRCLQLNIGGNIFDADMQFYPFVQYKFGTDFTVEKNCYTSSDTLKFKNLYKSNVCGSVYYNRYIYWGYDQFCHRWTYDNFSTSYSINGLYKPPVKKDISVRLISSVYSYSGGICNDTADKMDYFKPNLPSLKKTAKACKGQNTTIDVVTDASAMVDWFKSPSDKTPVYTGFSYPITNAQQNDSFYVQAYSGNCKTAFLKINFKVYDYPNDPIVSGDSICIGAVANLGAKSNIGNIEWYNDPIGGTYVHIGENLQTGKLTADSTFYVEANNNGCVNKGGRVEVTANVNNDYAPSKPIIRPDTSVCLRPAQLVVLKATQAGNDTLRWFNAPFSGSVIQKGDSFSFYPKQRGDEKYYVEAWNGTCGSGRVEVKVNIFDYPSIYGKADKTICKGEDAIITLSSSWGEIHWYDDQSQPPVFTGNAATFSGLNGPTTYYLKGEEMGCYQPAFDSIKVNVNVPPVPTLVKADPVCAKGIGTFTVKVPNGSVDWYYTASDTTPFYIGESFSEGPMLSNVTYYYRTTGNGCTSAKSPITVLLKPRPTAGFTWTLQWQNRLACTPITTVGLSIAWDWGDGTTSTNAPYLHQYNKSGNYTVRMVATSNSNGCKDTADIPVVIDHTAVKTPGTFNLNVYPNPVSAGSVLNVESAHLAKSHYALYSLTGSLIALGNISNNEIRIPLDLETGAYILRIDSGEGILRTKILISN